MRPVREKAGLGSLRLFASGAAPLAPDVFWGFTDLGFLMVEGYGLTETSPVACLNLPSRTSPGGVPAVYGTRNGGKSWQKLVNGLPKKNAWFTVKRQAMTADARDPVGLYFGTTSGELWMSRDEGSHWTSVARHLPEIYAVETATLR